MCSSIGSYDQVTNNGSTDSLGTSTYNLRLAIGRVKSLTEYLTIKGISKIE
jgi:outer membrane protein OmpA-like peptidoglycan-associated protein